ncbi:hypothetical protein EXU57_09290 [Segetibacter sp. 3557_3]|uniref:hypothetical protein n=1 Tax=Segetibacter sp. 3557_3 TaxID=2547429 RepID=UPI0010588D22|nr:hypothetical protein [Segetibacter sp. 3557_3]TDH26987.1 hypothetical protein EXU57_09290 [Segetibacter sp. 3557_3]
MKEEILMNIDNPRQLEQLYRVDKQSFRQTFTTLYPNIKDKALAAFWHERLSFTRQDVLFGNRKELALVIIAAILAGLVAKLPAIFSLKEDVFYQRNIGFIVFPLLSAYFAWKNRLSAMKSVGITSTILFGVLFINAFPNKATSDTLLLSCAFLLLFLWAILGFAFVGGKQNDHEKRLSFLRYNGDLVVMTTLILIAGGIMSAITVGLFGLIGLKIEKIYFSYVGIFGLAAAPIVGTYLTQNNPHLVGKVSPVIAKIFSPLVLLMLVVYLVAMVYSGKDPYNDREFLMIFNALLVGVMAIIFFSVAGTSATTRNPAQIWILFLLSTVTIIVNGIALSAILFRISSLGITPNRAAVLGSNVIILVNLFLVTATLFKAVTNKDALKSVGRSISSYLPVYVVWAIIVTFIFPLVFGFK